MLSDNISNIDKYSIIPVHIKEFIKKLPSDCGRYNITDDDFVNIEEYYTKSHDLCYFETHEKYADIQLLLEGKERIDYTDVRGLKLKEEYNEEKDIAFWCNSKKESASVYLNGTNFVLLMPGEAHRPQMNYEQNSEKVKKVVVKIKV